MLRPNLRHPLNKSLAMWVPFTEGVGDTAYDIVRGAECRFNSMDNSNWISGPTDNKGFYGISLDGSAEYLDFPKGLNWMDSNVPEKELTIAFWIKLNTTNSDTSFIHLVSNSEESFGVRNWIGAGRVEWRVRLSGGGLSYNTLESTDIDDGEWWHVVCRASRRDFGGTDDVFLNGKLGEEASVLNDELKYDYFDTLHIGYNGSSTYTLMDFADFRLYGRSLSATEIEQLYHRARYGYGDMLRSDRIIHWGQAAAATSYTLTAALGAYTLSGQDVSLKKDVVLSATTAGTYTLSGQDVDTLRAILLSADAGSYTLAGQDVDTLRSLVLDAEAGAYSLSGQDVDTLRSLVLDAEAGAYTLSGQDVSFLIGFFLDAEAGGYTLSGQAVSLLGSLLITADAGSYTLAGQDVTLEKSGAATLDAEAGSYTLSGQDITFLRDLILKVDTAGTYTLSGQDVNFLLGSALAADTGSYALSGQDVSLLRDKLLGASTGSYTLSGKNVTLTYSGAVYHDYIVLTDPILSVGRTESPVIVLARGSDTKVRIK